MFKSFMMYFGRYLLINDRNDSEPYLERYYIFLKDRITFPFNIFIHKFLKSDTEDLHDHPWDFISIPLWPGYYEHTVNKVEWRGPGSFRYFKAETLHRIELGPKKYCWTLFIPLKKKRIWGFNTKDKGWINNEDYLNTTSTVFLLKTNNLLNENKDEIDENLSVKNSPFSEISATGSPPNSPASDGPSLEENKQKDTYSDAGVKLGPVYPSVHPGIGSLGSTFTP